MIEAAANVAEQERLQDTIDQFHQTAAFRCLYREVVKEHTAQNRDEKPYLIVFMEFEDKVEIHKGSPETLIIKS